MFFTISRKKNVLIYLHNCPARNQALITSLTKSLSGYNIVWITKENDAWWRAFGVSDTDIFASTSATEARLFQNVIRRAMLSRNLSRMETLILATQPNVLESATQLLLGTIYLEIDQTVRESEIDQFGVDFGTSDYSTDTGIAGILNGDIIGYASEVIAAPASCRAIPIGTKNYLNYGWIDNLETGTRDYYGGRYFSQKDSRHDLHPLSLRIIDSKNNSRQAATFRSIFAFLIGATTGGNFDYISHVPPKPGQTDRFIPFLAGIENEAALQQHGVRSNQIRNDLLVCIKNFDSLKKFGAALRPQIIKGAFMAHPDVAGKKVVLLDDVRTTGSTLTECIKTLMTRGAKKVIPITIAYKPFRNIILPALSDTPPPTSCCDWPHVVRFNRTSGEPFFGCSAWHNDDRVKHGTGTFSNVRQQIMSSSDVNLMAYDSVELDSWLDY